MLRIGSKQVQRLNRDVEASAVCVFPDAGSERNEVCSGYVGGAFHEGLARVIDLVLVEAETVATWVFGIRAFVRRVVYDVLEVVAHEFV